MEQIELLPEDYNKYDFSFKIIIIGDAGSGKSSLSTKAIKNVFEDSYSATVGFEFLTFNIKIEKKVIKLQIWDTCGQEIYRSLISSFYRNATLAIIVYSIDDKDSFIHVENWLKEIKCQSNPDIKIFLVGNKCDLEKSRQISKEEGLEFKKDNNLDMFMEVSAKKGDDAKKIFIEAAKILYESCKDYINQKKIEIKNKEEKDKEENDKEESEEEEEEDNKTRKIEIGKKCSFDKHKEDNAVYFCPECRIFMCNKCENKHSELFINHHFYKLDQNLDEIFTGFCKENNHYMKLDYYCKNHNKLVCSSCITKIKGKGNGEHNDCEIYFIKRIKKKKKKIIK